MLVTCSHWLSFLSKAVCASSCVLGSLRLQVLDSANLWQTNGTQVRVWSMKELRFSQRYTSPPLVCHRRHRISAQPLSPEPEPVSSDLLVKASPNQMIKSHATASLSELDPNLIHGESEHSREDKSYSMSPMLDRRKRPRTIRDYFSLPN